MCNADFSSSFSICEYDLTVLTLNSTSSKSDPKNQELYPLKNLTQRITHVYTTCTCMKSINIHLITSFIHIRIKNDKGDLFLHIFNL